MCVTPQMWRERRPDIERGRVSECYSGPDEAAERNPRTHQGAHGFQWRRGLDRRRQHHMWRFPCSLFTGASWRGPMMLALRLLHGEASQRRSRVHGVGCGFVPPASLRVHRYLVLGIPPPRGRSRDPNLAPTERRAVSLGWRPAPRRPHCPEAPFEAGGKLVVLARRVRSPSLLFAPSASGEIAWTSESWCALSSC